MTGALLITGAGGFLGRRVTKLAVARGCEVVAVLRPGTPASKVAPGVEPLFVDLARWQDLRGERLPRLSAVVHLAQSRGYREFPAGASETAAVAVGATVRLAELAVERGAQRFVLASSGGVYGPSASELTETAAVRPAGELGFYLGAKAAAEALLDPFERHLHVSRLRFFFIYGPGQREDLLMGRLLNSVRAERAVQVAQGRGPRLNPVFVDDAAEMVLSSALASAPRVVNIAGNAVRTLRGLVEELANLVGTRPVFESTPEAPQDYVASTKLMEQCFGPPRVDLTQGLRQLALPDMGAA